METGGAMKLLIGIIIGIGLAGGCRLTAAVAHEAMVAIDKAIEQ
jgi:hypothetical protein